MTNPWPGPTGGPSLDLFRLDGRVVLATGSGGGIGRVLALAYAAILLASDAAAFMTGQVIVVDGGFLAGGSWEYQSVSDVDDPARDTAAR